MTPTLFLRDTIFYAIAIIYLLFILLSVGHFNIYTSFILLLIYSTYVIIVVFQDAERSQAKQDKDNNRLNKLLARFKSDSNNQESAKIDLDEPSN